MAARVICLSRTVSARADEVAARVGDALGFRCVDEEVIARAAERRHVDPAIVADAEKRKSFLARVFEDIGMGGGMSAYGAGFLPDPGVLPPRSDQLRSLIRDAIFEIADEGDVVIVAHAASYALGQRDDVLRVLVTGSLPVRAARLAAAEGKSAADAAQAIRQSDASRADYLRRFHGVDRELPEHYDLCLSTDVMTVAQAADQIVAAAQTLRS